MEQSRRAEEPCSWLITRTVLKRYPYRRVFRSRRLRLKRSLLLQAMSFTRRFRSSRMEQLKQTRSSSSFRLLHPTRKWRLRIQSVSPSSALYHEPNSASTLLEQAGVDSVKLHHILCRWSHG